MAESYIGADRRGGGGGESVHLEVDDLSIDVFFRRFFHIPGFSPISVFPHASLLAQSWL